MMDNSITNTQELKLTDIGFYPIDWEIISLKDVSKYRRGSFPQPYGLSKWYNDFNGAPFIQVFDVDEKFKLKKETKRRISKLAQQMSVFVKKGSIVLTIQGSIGRIAITQYDAYVDRTLLLFESFLKPVDTYYFAYSVFKLFEKEKLYAPGGIIKTITKERLSSFLIALPPLNEQKEISNILYKIDSLIENQEKQIEKKQAIKKGLMQKLLTGKQRLTGFKENWRKLTLFELADNKKDLFNDGDWIEARYLANDGIRLVQTGNIGIGEFHNNNKKYISNDSFEKLKCKEVKIGDVLICRLAEPAGRACIMTNIGENKMITSVDVTIFRPDPTLADPAFLVYIFSQKDWFYKVSELCGGSTRSRIARSALGKIEVLLPDVKEQRAISKIVTDINDEINLLGNKLDKLIEIRKGALQILLTGKVRLVNN